MFIDWVIPACRVARSSLTGSSWNRSWTHRVAVHPFQAQYQSYCPPFGTMQASDPESLHLTFGTSYNHMSFIRGHRLYLALLQFGNDTEYPFFLSFQLQASVTMDFTGYAKTRLNLAYS